MASQEGTFPEGSRVLVTGANGFIASNIIDFLLSNGYTVRGTVRNPKPYLDDIFHKAYGKESFESVLLPSFEETDALNRALDGISGIIHTPLELRRLTPQLAADLSFNPDPKAVIPWVVTAALKILEAAAKTPSVKSVVFFSSSSAAYMTLPGGSPLVVDKDSYNDMSVKLAWDETTPHKIKPLAIYAASKTEAERQAWKWMEDHKPHFKFNTILPGTTYGRMLHAEKPSSMIVPHNLLNGEAAYAFMIEQWSVDVQDIARLSSICLLDPAVKSERIFAMAETLHPADMALILREIKPNNKSIPVAPDTKQPRVNILPRKRTEELLQKYGRDGFSSVKEAIARGVESFERLGW